MLGYQTEAFEYEKAIFFGDVENTKALDKFHGILKSGNMFEEFNTNESRTAIAITYTDRNVVNFLTIDLVFIFVKLDDICGRSVVQYKRKRWQ